MTGKHYYQGGYDFEFVEELERSKFECPICLLCLRDPHQTSCGHRFCYSCILTWLGEGKTCPEDNCSLGEGDIYADTGINREILQLKVRCLYRVEGCTAEMKVADREAHAKTCSFKTNKYTDDFESLSCTDCGELISLENQHSNIICPRALVACPFSLVGCSQKIQRIQLQEHVRSQISHHMQLMAEKLLKIQQQQSAVDCCYTQEYPEALAASPNCSSVPGSPRLTRNQEFRVSGSNLQNNTKLLRECFQRLIQTEQKNCQLQIRLEHLESLINQTSTEKEEELKGKLCNGKFVWKISEFTSLYQKMIDCPSFVIYSRPFYSSVYGYKMCLRCNITLQNGEQHLGVFLHLMQGENDDSVFWPFQGSIFLTILNQGPGLHREHVSEHLESDPALGAFQKPNSFRNLRGFGFQEFVRLNSLLAGGFIKNDTLIIKADVKQHEEV